MHLSQRATTAFSGCEGAIVMSDFTIGDSVPETDFCDLSLQGPVAHLTIRREDVFNALSPELIDEV